MKRYLLAAVAVLASTGTPGPVHGDEQRDEPAAVPAVVRFLDEHAIGLVRIDLERVNVAALLEKVGDVLKLSQGQRTGLAETERQLADRVASLRKAGVRELYFVISLATLPPEGDPAFAAVPVPEGGDRRAVRELMAERGLFRFERCEEMDGVVVCGSRRTLARLRDSKPVPRPGLAQALEAAGETAVQALLLPTDDHRRVVREMLRELPEELGGGSGAVLAEGIQWGAAGLSVEPRLSLRLVIQSADAEAAQGLEELFRRTGRRLAGMPVVREQAPMIAALLETVTPRAEDDRLILTLDERTEGVRQVLAAAAAPVLLLRERARTDQCRDKLKQLGLAMHNFHDAYGSFPPSASYDEEGKPLLSWRVFLLPYLEQQELYKQFRLEEPWDSEHNRKLIEKMPEVYACPSVGLRKDGKTTYLAPVGKETIFDGREGVPVREIKDGTSNTILLVDVDPEHAVIWTKPDDLRIDLDKPHQGLTGNHDEGFHVLLGDGAMRRIGRDVPAKTLRALFTKAGGEVVDGSKVP